MLNDMKKLCDECKVEMAVWSYMPSKGDYCETCVPRGCSCNRELTPENPLATYDGLNLGMNPPKKKFKWIENGMVWCHVDELGREYPCCEFSFYENGIDLEENV